MAAASDWRGKRVLVTGATGLLGGWLTEALLERGAEVVALVRDGVPRSRFYERGLDRRAIVVRGEVEALELVARALNEYEVHTVFHLAAQTIVRTANKDPLSTFESNIRGTWCVLEACRRLGVARVVVASSDKAYGPQPVLPYDEQTPLAGLHPYDVSKSCADLIARAFARTYDLPVCVTRCGNLFGAGDLNWNRIVPGTIRSVLHGEPPVIRSDGTLVRDYFYVEDGVDAYLGLAEKMDSPGVRGEAFNFSHELSITVSEIVARILRLMGREDLLPIVLSEAPNEIPNQVLSAAKAREVLGWRPRFTFDEGLARTIAWYKEYFSKTDE